MTYMPNSKHRAMKKLLVSALVVLPWCGLVIQPQARTSRPTDPVDVRIARGLVAWRKPGAINYKAACANCHGPDGYELAMYNFDDTDLRRRAKPHLSASDAEDIVTLVHAVREKYGIKKLLDPMKDRPFQPGGEVLPGATPEERDLAFGLELTDKLPPLMKGRVENLEAAKKASVEVMGLNPWTLKIGIPLNRISEDIFHGSEHASIANWISDTPRIPEDQTRNEWYALEDSYLANPTDDNLWKLFEGYDKLTKQTGVQNVNDLSSMKQKSLFMLQHLARTGRLNPEPDRPPIYFGDLTSVLVPNQIWDVGNLARDFMPGDPESLGFDEDLKLKKTSGPTIGTQLADMRVSWMYLGWLFDQGLYRTSFDKRVRRGEWIQTSIWQDGPYAIHNVYVSTRHQLVLSWSPKVWSGDPGRRHYTWDYAQLMLGQRHLHQRPENPKHREIYDRFTANCFRMSLQLLIEDLEKNHVIWLRDPSRAHVKQMLEFLNTVDPSYATQDKALVDQVLTSIDASTERV